MKDVLFVLIAGVLVFITMSLLLVSASESREWDEYCTKPERDQKYCPKGDQQ